jgi:hypothetical protein
VSSVQETIHGTVDTVKETFDLELQVRNHPWAMVGGAFCAGYLGGKVIHSLSSPMPLSHPLASPTTAPVHLSGAHWSESRSTPSPVQERSQTETLRPRAESWSGSLIASVEPEVEKLKGLAIGAVFNVLKSLVRQHLPPSVEPQLEEMVDNVTRRMGGKPIQGSLMEEFQHNGR